MDYPVSVISLLDKAAIRFANRPYLGEKTGEHYSTLSFLQTRTKALDIAAWLAANGIERGDRIAILSEGRSDWVIAEFGMLMTGAVAVPLSIKLLSDEVLFRLEHSGAKAIFLSKNTLPLFQPIADKIVAKNFKVICLDSDATDEAIKIIPVSTVYKYGREVLEANRETIDARIAAIKPNYTATISYTSGTSGNPKGIMLTHRNYVANSSDSIGYFNIKKFSRQLVILPLDHSFAHTIVLFASLIRGLSVFFVDSRGGSRNALKNIPINLKEVRPDFMLTVPALSGNFMAKISEGIRDRGGIAERLFNAGISARDKIAPDGFHRSPFVKLIIPLVVAIFADLIVMRKVRSIFGSKLRFCVGGGALLDVRQQKFFRGIGVPIYQGYGLTEATPVISTNKKGAYVIGSSGKVLPSIKCRFVDSDGREMPRGVKGEIVISGPNVMKGYFRNPEASDAVLRNGELFTGDLGYFESDGFLVVCGREKALLISHDGEKYSPEEIEEAIASSSQLISQVMVYNDHCKFTSAIITLDPTELRRISGSLDTRELVAKVRDEFYRFKNSSEYAGRFPDKWIPSTFRIAPEPFTEQNRMQNSTMKMVRHVITNHYADVIEKIYSDEGTAVDVEHNLRVLIELTSVRKFLLQNYLS